MGLFDNDLGKDIDKYLEYKEYLKEECKRYVQDTTRDLDERWHFFMNKAIGKEKKGWIWHPKNKRVDKWVQDLLDRDWYRKHQTIFISAVAQDMYADEEINRGLYDEIRESMLEDYIESFVLDW